MRRLVVSILIMFISLLFTSCSDDNDNKGEIQSNSSDNSVICSSNDEKEIVNQEENKKADLSTEEQEDNRIMVAKKILDEDWMIQNINDNISYDKITFSVLNNVGIIKANGKILNVYYENGKVIMKQSNELYSDIKFEKINVSNVNRLFNLKLTDEELMKDRLIKQELSQKDKDMIKSLICELIIFHDNNETNSIIPKTNDDVIKLVYMLLCDNIIDYEQYKTTSMFEDKIIVPFDEASKISESIINYTLSEDEDNEYYHENNLEFIIGNSGESSVNCMINKSYTIGPNEIEINGIIKKNAEDKEEYTKKYICNIVKNPQSYFNGYTIKDIKLIDMED